MNVRAFRLRPIAEFLRMSTASRLSWGALASIPGLAFAGPSGESVVAGGAAISRPDATRTQIDQSTHSAVINWSTFSVDGDEFVVFNQPGATASVLNRVIGTQQSNILGQINADGRVFLVNPQGVYFAPGAKVDVGALTASVLDITNEDFMSGTYVFRRSAGAPDGAGVENAGEIKVGDGGYVVLAGDYANNTGVISARLGTVVLAAGSQMTLDLSDDGLVSFAVDAATVSSLAGANNAGAIVADGGQVIMTAKVANDLVATAVNNTGLLQAHRIVEDGGEIYLSASGGDIVNAGTLDVSAEDGQAGGEVGIVGDENITLAAGSEINAHETLFVVDAGAALSVRHVTGKPIKFVGVGEKIDALEPFHPDRMASRILGMGINNFGETPDVSIDNRALIGPSSVNFGFGTVLKSAKFLASGPLTFNGAFSADRLAVGVTAGDVTFNSPVTITGVKPFLPTAPDLALFTLMSQRGLTPPSHGPNVQIFAQKGINIETSFVVDGPSPFTKMFTNGSFNISGLTTTASNILSVFSPIDTTRPVFFEHDPFLQPAGASAFFNFPTIYGLPDNAGTTIVLGEFNPGRLPVLSGPLTIGSNGPIDIGDRNMFIITRGLVTGDDLVSTTGIFEVIGLALTNFFEIPIVNELGEKIGEKIDDEEDDEEDDDFTLAEEDDDGGEEGEASEESGESMECSA